MYQLESISYPVTKETYGKSAWQILHSAAATMPAVPVKSDKIQFRQFLARMLHYFPCESCKVDAHEYIKQNPPKMSNKIDLQNWLCDFHNDVNKKSGKPTVDCTTMIKNSVIARPGTNEDCISCKIVNDKKSNDNEQSPNQPDLPGIGQKSRISVGSPSADTVVTGTLGHNSSSSFKDIKINNQSPFNDLKTVSEKVLYELLQAHGIPNPQVYHESCPEKSDTSCTHFPVSPTNELVKSAPVRIYLDPNVASPRTIAHEAIHIIKKYRKNEHFNSTINEQEVEKEARELIAREFPKSATKPPDEVGKTVVEYDKKTKKSQSVESIQDRAQKRLAEYKNNLPRFASYFKESTASPPTKQPSLFSLPPSPFVGIGGGVQAPIPAETVLGPPPGSEHGPDDPPAGSHFSEGVLAMLDPVYRPFADALGLLPRHVNEAHTPEILGQIAVAGAESNLNLFGSLMVSLLGASITLISGTMAKDQLGIADRKLLVQLGAHLLWNPLTYVASKPYRDEVIENAKDFGQAVSTFNTADIIDSLVPVAKQRKTQIRQAEEQKALEKRQQKRNAYLGDTGTTGNIMKGASPKPFKLASLTPSSRTGPGGMSSPMGGRTYEVDSRGRSIDGGRTSGVLDESDILEDGESMIDLDPFAPALA